MYSCQIQKEANVLVKHALTRQTGSLQSKTLSFTQHTYIAK